MRIFDLPTPTKDPKSFMHKMKIMLNRNHRLKSIIENQLNYDKQNGQPVYFNINQNNFSKLSFAAKLIENEKK